jgi:hypothetical protein
MKKTWFSPVGNLISMEVSEKKQAAFKQPI